MCPIFFALGATTLASMPHQVQAPFFWWKGGCVKCPPSTEEGRRKADVNGM